MKLRDVTRLMNGYGFEAGIEDEEQRKTRWQGEFTFVDIWNGKKGFTVGIYNQKTKSMWYAHPYTIENLEDVLIKATKT